MGLDLIPHKYECDGLASTIRTPDGRIDCTANIEAGLCPYTEAQKRDPFDGHVTGMFGTTCWYRGKMGTFMLEAFKQYYPQAGVEIDTHAFYGDDGDADTMSVDHARKIAGWMEDHAEMWAMAVSTEDHAKARIDQWGSAIWWLRHTADVAEARGDSICAEAWY